MLAIGNYVVVIEALVNMTMHKPFMDLDKRVQDWNWPEVVKISDAPALTMDVALAN